MKKEDSAVKRNAKDSVFCNLFSYAKYQLMLYQALHPEDVKSEYSLADEFFDGDRNFMDARVRVITDGRQCDIINQYVTFTRVLNEQIKVHGRTKEAISETIRICKDKRVLDEYLTAHEQEVTDIMDILFDQDYNMKILNKQLAEKERNVGRNEGKSEGEKDKGIKVALKMIANNESDDKIQDYTDLSLEDIQTLRSGKTVTA